MYGYIVPENQLELLDKVINQMDELIDLIVTAEEFDPVIHQTAGRVITFLNKIIKLIPESVIINDINFRSEMIKDYEKIVNSWPENSFPDPAFMELWKKFRYSWESYRAQVGSMDDSDNIIISMN